MNDSPHAGVSLGGYVRDWAKVVIPAEGRGIVRNSAYSLMGFLIPAAVFLVTTPLLLRQMGAFDFGLWSLALSFLGFLGIFDLGLATAMGKFIAQYQAQGDTDRLSAAVTTSVVMYLVIGIVLAVPVYALAPEVASLFKHDEVAADSVVTQVIRLAALGFVPLMMKSAALAVPVGLQRFKVPMVLSTLQTILTLGVALIVVDHGGSVTDVVASSVFVLVVVSVSSLLIAYLLLRPLGARILFSRSQTRLIAGFIMYTSISSLGIVLFSYLDRVVVGAVLGVAAVAYYAIAVGISVNLLTLADVLTRPLMPAASSWVASGQWVRAGRYLARSTMVILVLELLASITLLLISRPFLDWWLGPEFSTAVLGPLRILLVAYAGIAVAAPSYHLANGVGLPWLPALWGVVGGFLSLVLIVALGGAWNLPGAAWANFAYWTNLLIIFFMRSHIRRRTAQEDRLPSSSLLGTASQPDR
jgi:O-antigen/teichoic acid export membrane protein